MRHKPPSIPSANWEHGSEFHLIVPSTQTTDVMPWQRSAAFFASGRAALLAILLHGIAHNRWQRLWMPSYYCSDVVDTIISQQQLEIRFYPFFPEKNQLEIPSKLKRGDVVLLANIFGNQSIQRVPDLPEGVEIIEDHTHDPWSAWAYESSASWCFASLRKTLPLPDGAVLWSPQNQPLPKPETLASHNIVYLASLQKLSAMMLKQVYLRNQPVDKKVFRQLAVSGERNIATNEPNSITPWSLELMKTFPILDWRRKRAVNWKVMHDLLAKIPDISVLHPPTIDTDSVTPFAMIVRFSSNEIRECVRKKILEQRIYPSVLWSLDYADRYSVPDQNIDLSQQILSFHIDMRYDETDLNQVAMQLIVSLRNCLIHLQ